MPDRVLDAFSTTELDRTTYSSYDQHATSHYATTVSEARWPTAESLAAGGTAFTQNHLLFNDDSTVKHVTGPPSNVHSSSGPVEDVSSYSSRGDPPTLLQTGRFNIEADANSADDER